MIPVTLALIYVKHGIETVFKAPFFQEFVVKLSGNIAEINQELLKEGIIGGLDLGCYYPELAGNMLLCVTENRTKAQIDALVVGLGAKACKKAGIDIVRRLTGGRAVLHSRELTYSIIVGEDYPGMPMTITASYRYLSKGLLLGLEDLGLMAEMTKPISSYGQHARQPASAACFDAPSNYELTIDRRKLIGSAQVRKHEG